MKRIFTVCLLIYSFLLLGCPKTIEKAESSSAKLATYANAGVNVTRDLFRQGVISREKTNDIAKAFSVMADAGIAFDAAVRKAKAAYGTEVPKSEINALFATFDAEVVAKLLGVLATLGVLKNLGPIAAVIESLRTAVILIAGAFGRKQQVEAKLA